MSELGIKSSKLRKRGIIYDRNRTTATLAHSCAALQKERGVIPNWPRKILPSYLAVHKIGFVLAQKYNHISRSSDSRLMNIESLRGFLRISSQKFRIPYLTLN